MEEVVNNIHIESIQDNIAADAVSNIAPPLRQEI